MSYRPEFPELKSLSLELDGSLVSRRRTREAPPVIIRFAADQKTPKTGSFPARNHHKHPDPHKRKIKKAPKITWGVGWEKYHDQNPRVPRDDTMTSILHPNPWETEKTLTMKSTVKLRNGVSLPCIGLGTWNSPANRTADSCRYGLRAGYRLIDTGGCYKNEAEIGHVVANPPVKEDGSETKRDEFMVTTKVLVPKERDEEVWEETVNKVKQSCQLLDPRGHRVDLFLIHSPKADGMRLRDMWWELGEMYEARRVQAIGVSNFGIEQIEWLKTANDGTPSRHWPPHVNQIELHPWCQQRDIVAYCKRHNIVVEAYCPMVRNQKHEHPVLQAIAEKHKKTPNQVLVRWSLQNGYVPLVKSDHERRIIHNADVFTFGLDDKDMLDLYQLDEGKRGAIVEAVDNEASYYESVEEMMEWYKKRGY